MRSTRRLGAAAAAVLVVLACGYLENAAASPIVLPNGVQVRPSNTTPHVENGGNVPHVAVYALKDLDDTMYAGGKFERVSPSNRSTTLTRRHLFRFDATTGAIDSWSPNLDGPVWAIETDPATNSVWVGGTFRNVNGFSRNGIVKFDASTGAVDTSFSSGAVAGSVSEIKLVNGHLIVGGSFSKRLVSLDPETGANDGHINVSITGRVQYAGATKVYRFAVDPAGTRLVAIGNFTAVNGAVRHRAFMLDLDGPSATLDAWYYEPLQNHCRAAKALPAYLRDVDFSSDGSWFAIVSTGFIPVQGGLGRDVCDATARFETSIDHPFRPTWINYTVGDTLHAVAISGQNVYVQGHQRWLNNAGGADWCNVAAGCVSRPGIGALDATTGLATSWNPTKTRGVGGKDLLITPEGLWVGSDGAMFNGTYHHGIAFCPRL